MGRKSKDLRKRITEGVTREENNGSKVLDRSLFDGLILVLCYDYAWKFIKGFKFVSLIFLFKLNLDSK